MCHADAFAILQHLTLSEVELCQACPTQLNENVAQHRFMVTRGVRTLGAGSSK